ncbi:unnamed protein product [Symbiodinium natans]|uniref:Uncharacterized protein n=1 Tax=Symbiodinium natans TaxID=878477 RepID=A0A812LUK0_9DINO|nr:unnamed protein product [Symbiodinium natans]
MRLRTKYEGLFANVRRKLFNGQPYLALYWSGLVQHRGEAPSAENWCKAGCAKVATSSKPMRPEDLRAHADSLLYGRKWPVYLVTDEQDPETLHKFRKLGFQFHAGQAFGLTSLEAFFADIYLYGCSAESSISHSADAGLQYFMLSWQHHAKGANICDEVATRIA